MKTLKEIEESKVIILIGKKKKGTSNLQKPIRSIVVCDTNVKEIKSKIEDMIKSESK